ncbi:MAG: hypothetical protein NUV92_08390 [Ignavibacteria bacterium]|jgi:hypothetical protein|nr:hypothetical protein [Ignavibacteria bacterium]MDH7527233.1 hypothetical protein [Ignavibacteria bacterium]
MIKKEEYACILSLLNKCVNSNPPLSELSKLIAYIKKLILPYIFHTKKEFLYFSQRFGFTAYDLAMDVIVEFLRKNEEEKFIVIAKLIENFNQGNTEENLVDNFIKLQSLLRKICDNCVAKTYAEFDKEGAKLVRNIKNALPSKKLNYRKTFLDFVVYLENSTNNCTDLITYDELKHHFISNDKEKKNIPQLLEFLADRMEELNYKKGEILFNDVVKLFKTYYNLIQDNLEDDYYENSLSFEIDINSIDLQILEERISKKVKEILLSYLLNNKLTKDQIEAMFYTIKDIFYDIIKFNQVNYKFFDYFNQYYPCTSEEYNLKFKTKLEYLSKIVREQIIIYLNL